MISVLVLAVLSSSTVAPAATQGFCRGLLNVGRALFGASVQRLDTHDQQLGALGFRPLGETGLLRRAEVTIETRPAQAPLFWRDLTDANLQKLIRIARNERQLIVETFDNNTLNTQDFSPHGGYGGHTRPSPRVPADPTPLPAQLRAAGFTDAGRGRWVLALGPNLAVLAVLDAKGRLQALLRSVTVESPLLTDPGLRFVSYRRVDSNVLSPRSILTVETAMATAEFGADGHVFKTGSKGDLDAFRDDQLGVLAVTPKREGSSSFMIGGRNDDAAISGLHTLNGLPIAQLERVMRPNGASVDGFLGADESLLATLRHDNTFVRTAGTDHQTIARHLKRIEQLGNLGFTNFVYHGRRFDLQMLRSKGWQDSPFEDRTANGTDFKLTNLDSGESLEGGWLVVDMIERYGFYEGRGTRYRLDPAQILRTLDFLAPAPRR